MWSDLGVENRAAETRVHQEAVTAFYTWVVRRAWGDPGVEIGGITGGDPAG